MITYLNFYLDNAWVLADDTNSDKKIGEPLKTIKVPNTDHINILKLEKEFDLKRQDYFNSVYRIEGTNKYIIYFADVVFMEHLKQHFRETPSIKK